VLGDIGTAAGRIGGQMIEGIKNGISNAWSGLIAYLKNLLFGIPIIGDFLKQLWGGGGGQAQNTRSPGAQSPVNTGGGVSANSYGVPGSGRSGGGQIGDPRGPQIIEIHLDGSVISRVLADRQELRTGKRAGAGV
jgi:hypothetical protein